MKQPFCRRHCCEYADLCSAAGLSHDCDTSGITSEIGYVVAYPFKCCYTIQHADVARRSKFFTGSAEMGISKRTEAVVNGDKYSVGLPGKIFAMVSVLFNSVSVGIPTSM